MTTKTFFKLLDHYGVKLKFNKRGSITCANKRPSSPTVQLCKLTGKDGGMKALEVEAGILLGMSARDFLILTMAWQGRPEAVNPEDRRQYEKVRNEFIKRCIYMDVSIPLQ